MRTTCTGRPSLGGVNSGIRRNVRIMEFDGSASILI